MLYHINVMINANNEFKCLEFTQKKIYTREGDNGDMQLHFEPVYINECKYDPNATPTPSLDDSYLPDLPDAPAVPDILVPEQPPNAPDIPSLTPTPEIMMPLIPIPTTALPDPTLSPEQIMYPT